MKSVNMTFSKSTKHTHVYQSAASDAAVKTIYIEKFGLSNPAPKEIEIVIKEK